MNVKNLFDVRTISNMLSEHVGNSQVLFHFETSGRVHLFSNGTGHSVYSVLERNEVTNLKEDLYFSLELQKFGETISNTSKLEGVTCDFIGKSSFLYFKSISGIDVKIKTLVKTSNDVPDVSRFNYDNEDLEKIDTDEIQSHYQLIKDMDEVEYIVISPSGYLHTIGRAYDHIACVNIGRTLKHPLCIMKGVFSNFIDKNASIYFNEEYCVCVRVRDDIVIKYRFPLNTLEGELSNRFSKRSIPEFYMKMEKDVLYQGKLIELVDTMKNVLKMWGLHGNREDCRITISPDKVRVYSGSNSNIPGTELLSTEVSIPYKFSGYPSYQFFVLLKILEKVVKEDEECDIIFATPKTNNTGICSSIMAYNTEIFLITSFRKF